MHKGYLCLVLHGHLPYVRHPEHEDFLEEDWLYEAITETYIPLISIFEKLLEDNVDFRITMTLSPTLISMLMDPLLTGRYLKHINKLIELAHKEIERTSWQPSFQHLAIMYLNNFCNSRDIFEKYKRNLITAFKKFQDAGKLEIITCGATHGYFPLMDVSRDSVRAQVKVAVSHYEKVFGRKPPTSFKGGREEGTRESLRARKHKSYAARNVRPLRRRFCTIFRPELVFFRERNPCVLARLFLFGW